ncbi:MAG: NAD(P)H-binding protein [Bacteroidales bacterium]
MNKIQKIAIIGGTGKAGKYLVNELVKQEFPIKVLARNPENLLGHSPLIEVIPGNARDYNSILKLLTGCDAVISALGPSGSEPDTCSVAVGHIIKAMQELHIKRYIELAGLAIDTPDDKKGWKTRLVVALMKRLFPAIINDRQKAYELLSASDLSWTIVRSSMIKLTDTKRVLKTSLSDCPGSRISAADLTVFLIDQLTDERFIRKCPFVAS